jgi:coenzyme PQQ synthesis protein D (PqqD)
VTRYAVSPDAACAPVEDGAVVLNMRTKRYYSLNETGAMIWRLLEDEMAVEDVVARVVERYDVDEVEARRAVAVLLDELAVEALIAPVTA